MVSTHGRPRDGREPDRSFLFAQCRPDDEGRSCSTRSGAVRSGGAIEPAIVHARTASHQCRVWRPLALVVVRRTNSPFSNSIAPDSMSSTNWLNFATHSRYTK
jgi:hypothetical protein